MDRDAVEPARFKPAEEDEHPLVRLLDQMPVIRFACRCDRAGGVRPMLVRCGDGLIDGQDDDDRWRKLLERVHPDDLRLMSPPGSLEPVRQRIRLRCIRDVYCGYVFAHHRRSPDGVVWEGLLSETVASVFETRLSAITQHLPGVLYRCVIEGRSTRCTFVSPAVAQIFDLSPDEVLGDPERIWSRVHPEDCAGLSEAWYAAADRHELFDREFRIVLPDGELRWLRSIAQMSEAENGTVVADGITAEITRDRLAQEQLERRNRELLTLCRISEIALSSPSVGSGLEKMAREISEHMNFPTTAISIYDEHDQVVTVRGCHNLPGLLAAGSAQVPIQDTLAWEVIRTGRPLVETDACRGAERRFSFMRVAGNQTFVGVPIKIGGRAIGCLGLAHPDRLDPKPETVELLASWADSIASYIASRGEEELAPSRQDPWDLDFEAAFASRLTARQRDVLALLATGRSNRAIGEQLGLQEATVKIHVSAILKALGVRNRTQAAAIANSLSRRRARKRRRKGKH